MAAASPSSPEVAFISGPLDTGPDASYFRTYYVPLINAAIARGDHFVIGPLLQGVDSEALEYLLQHPISPSRITIFMTAGEDRTWGPEFRQRGVNVHVLEDISATTQHRDAAMTWASSYDILRWRKRGEARAFYGETYRDGYITNTERNWRRRRGMSETALVREEDVAFE